MICQKCFKQEFESKMVGRETNNGGKVIEVSTHEFTSLLLETYRPYFRIFYKAQKTLKNLKVKENTFYINHVANYCAHCGEKQDIKKVNDE